MVMVDELGDVLHWRPRGVLVEALAQRGEGHLVHGEDFSDVALPARSTLFAGPGKHSADQTVLLSHIATAHTP